MSRPSEQRPARGVTVTASHPESESEAQALLAPIIEASLPGYGDSSTPARCLMNASYPRMWMDHTGAVVGFAALNVVNVRNERCLYITLAAFLPGFRGGGLLSAALDSVIQSSGSTILAATTNVPAIYRLIQSASRSRFVDGRPRIAPAAATDGVAPVGKDVQAIALDILSAAVPNASKSLDEFLVRRAYRTRDLQHLPAPEYLASERTAAAGRCLNTEIVDLFADALELNVGDAVLVIAALGDDTAGGVTWPKG